MGGWIIHVELALWDRLTQEMHQGHHKRISFSVGISIYKYERKLDTDRKKRKLQRREAVSDFKRTCIWHNVTNCKIHLQGNVGVKHHISDASVYDSICFSHRLLPKALILLHFQFHALVMNSIHHCMCVSVASCKEGGKTMQGRVIVFLLNTDILDQWLALTQSL